MPMCPIAVPNPSTSGPLRARPGAAETPLRGVQDQMGLMQQLGVVPSMGQAA